MILRKNLPEQMRTLEKSSYFEETLIIIFNRQKKSLLLSGKNILVEYVFFRLLT